MAAPLNPRRWVEFILEPYPTASATTYRWSTRPLVGTTFVEAKVAVEGWEEISRKASSQEGTYTADAASVLIEDRDGTIRALLADVTTQWFKNREAAFKLLSEVGLATGLTPRILFGGRCEDAQLVEGRKARLTFEDVLAPYLNRQYPQYTLGDAYPYRFTIQDPTIVANLHNQDPGMQIPLELRDQVMPIYYGPHVDTAVDPVTGVARQKGLCPTYCMGYTHLTAGGVLATDPDPALAIVLTAFSANWGAWGELFVALGEVDIPNVYGSDLTTNPSRVRIDPSRYGTEFLIPGDANWPFPTNYVLRNGFRCTVIYARGPALWHHLIGLVNITVDVCGWKNSSGDAIDQAGFALQSFLSEHVLAHNGAGYTSGPEAGLPLFADGRAMIWTSKVDDWQTLTADRLGTAKGYLISMALTQKMTLLEILQHWCVTFDAFLAKNAAGQLYPFSIDDLADPDDGVLIRERQELLGLPAPEIAWDQIENSIDYQVGYDPEQDTPRTPTLNVKDQPAIDALKEERKPELRFLRFTADDATASDTIGRRLMRLKTPPRYQALPVRMGIVDREIGEQVRVSHQDGIGPAGVGYSATPMVILEHTIRGHAGELRAFDVRRILLAASRWALDTLADYDSASAADQQFFGFWSDDNDRVGAANDPAPEWR